MSRDPGSAFTDSLRTCAILAFLQMLAQLAFLGYRLALTLKGVHLQWSPWTLGLVMSAASLVPAVTAWYMGRLVDRVGHKVPALAGLAATGLAFALAAVTDRIWLLALGNMLAGAGATLNYVSLNLAVGVAAGPASRVRAYSLLTLGMSLAAALGPALSGWGVDAVGYAATFMLLLLPMAVAAVGLVRLPASRSEDPPLGIAGVRASRDGLLKYPAVRRVLLCSAMVTTAFDMFIFLVPLHGASHGLTATAVGLAVGAFGAGSFMARLGLPWLARRLPEWRMLQGVVLCTAAGFVLLPFCRTLDTLLPVGFMVGVVLGCGQPLLMTLTLASAPAGRSGETVGLRTAISSGLQAGTPLLAGALGSAFGLAPLFWGMALVMAGGGTRVGRNSGTRALP